MIAPLDTSALEKGHDVGERQRYSALSFFIKSIRNTRLAERRQGIGRKGRALAKQGNRISSLLDVSRITRGKIDLRRELLDGRVLPGERVRGGEPADRGAGPGPGSEHSVRRIVARGGSDAAGADRREPPGQCREVYEDRRAPLDRGASSP